MPDTNSDDILDRLMQQMFQRAKSMPPGSYTTSLMAAGTSKIAAKLREECDEVIDAAEQFDADPENPDTINHLVYEACDVIYHLWVMLGHKGVPVDRLRRELERREGVSGITEKQNRSN